jgi:hypothetical protein
MFAGGSAAEIFRGSQQFVLVMMFVNYEVYQYQHSKELLCLPVEAGGVVEHPGPGRQWCGFSCHVYSIRVLYLLIAF